MRPATQFQKHETYKYETRRMFILFSLLQNFIQKHAVLLTIKYTFHNKYNHKFVPIALLVFVTYSFCRRTSTSFIPITFSITVYEFQNL
jgi:hypothetical protein